MSKEQIKLTTCPVCGTEDFALMGSFFSPPSMNMETAYSYLPIAVRVSYDRCLRCGVIFQNPRMSDEAIEQYYSSGDYRLHTGKVNVDEDEKERSWRIVNDLDMIPTRHLDIGCSRGYLLQATKKSFGCGIQGVDTNPEYAVEGIPVVKDIKLVWGDFDLITAIHVLEHVTDPKKFLLSLTNRLKPGGTVIIEVPSMNSTGGPWRLAHTFHFEPWVLTLLCESVGFTVKSIEMKEHTKVELTNA
jgi:cyclopropane fatty-acyl-phospholipid synthase-like methyltransferase